MNDQLQPNPTLRRLMREYGLTREGLAKAVNDACEQLSGKPGNCSARLVGYWLSGKTTWPRSHSRRPLETVFGRPAEELGFRSPPKARGGVTVRTSVPAPAQDSPVQRRKFIVGFGSLIALPTLPESGRLGMTDIQRICDTEAQLLGLDDQYGSKQLADVAARYIEHVETSMRHCSYGGRVRTHLHGILGNMCAVTGWLSYDSDRHDDARRWWDTGLRYALLARDPSLQARIWSYMSRQAVDLGHGAEAVAIARTALDATRNRREPRPSALLHTRVALGHSVHGEKGRCAQSLHRAEVEIDHACGQPPAWLAFCGPDELAAQHGLCFSNLGDHAKAAQADHDALTLIQSGGFRRNTFATHVSLARNLLASGEADSALASGYNALALLPEVRSPRWSKHLTQFQQDVLNCGLKDAAEFADHYRRAAP